MANPNCFTCLEEAQENRDTIFRIELVNGFVENRHNLCKVSFGVVLHCAVAGALITHAPRIDRTFSLRQRAPPGVRARYFPAITVS